MDGALTQSLTWIGIAVALVAVFLVVELLLRTLINRFGTPADARKYRLGGRLPRVPQ